MSIYREKLDIVQSAIAAAMRDTLLLALQKGYYGNVDVSISIQDGVIQHTKVSNGRTIKFDPATGTLK